MKNPRIRKPVFFLVKTSVVGGIMFMILQGMIMYLSWHMEHPM